MSAPRATYVHVPFCRHRCGYCNFTVVAGRDDLVERYLQALRRELSWLQRPQPVDTLYLGGGTPTHLQGRWLDQLLEMVTCWFPLEGDGEYTVEANPEDVTEPLVRQLAGSGVTRLSLGVQSFDDAKLQMLERAHRSPQVRRAVELARRYLPDISLDLIFGVPGETNEVWRSDLAAARDLSPDHLSTYGLTFERGTAFWSRLQRGDLRCCDEDAEHAFYRTAIDTLIRGGWEHYEVSNFARPGKRCRHNETYWNGAPFFGVGAGAARYIDGRREVNHRSPFTYMKWVLEGASPVAEVVVLPPEDRARELLVIGLRRLDGVDKAEFRQRTGYDVDQLAGSTLQQLVDLGFLVNDSTRVRMTYEGLMVSDSLCARLLE